MVQLISTGTQDAFLTGNPKRTYFHSVYYRRTPFFLNAVQIPFIGTVKFGEQAICKIPQTGDIITGMSLQATLPRLGTPSNVYYYINQLDTFDITVNGATSNIFVPSDANTGNLSWLNTVPGITFDENLNVYATQSTAQDTSKASTVGADNVPSRTSPNDSVTFSVSSAVSDFEELVKEVPWTGLLYSGYDGIVPENGFLSRSSQFRTPLPSGQTPGSLSGDTSLQSNAMSNVYGETFTFTFSAGGKSFTELFINVPEATSPLSLVQVPGWVFVLGSNDGSNWQMAGPAQKSTTIRLNGNTWLKYRIVIASAESDSFRVSYFLFRKSTITTVTVSSDQAASLLCRDSTTFRVDGSLPPDTPLSQSPDWTYSAEQNISYVSNAGNILVEDATLKIGGQTIKRIEGEYMTLRQDLDVSEENQIGLTALVGKNDTQLVTEPKRYLVPVDFVENIPVCSLDKHDIEVHMTFSPFSNLLQYNGLGEFSPTSYSNVVGVSAVDGVLIGPTRLYTSGSSNITLNNGIAFSNVITGMPSGQIRSIYSNLYVFSGSAIKKDDGTTISTSGKAFGSDTVSNLYVFNNTSNIYSVYNKDLISTGNASVFSGPPGYVTATIGYTDIVQGVYRRVSVPLRITSTSTNSESSLVRIYSPSAGEYYANALVPWVNELIWDADYNANAYYSNLYTHQINLNNQTTTNVAASQSLDYTFRWNVRTDNGTVYTLPDGITMTPTVYVNGGLLQDTLGQPYTYYEGEFIRTLTYQPNKVPTDPYNVVVSDPTMYATFAYTRDIQGQWKTVRTSNLSTYLVQSAYRGSSNTSNVLYDFQSITFTGVSPNAVITYILPGGVKDTFIVNSSSGEFGPVINVYTLTNQVVATRADYVYSGTTLTISGCAVYSVTNSGVPATHIPLTNYSGTRTYNGISFPAVFDKFTAVANSSGRIDDRTTWSSTSSSVVIYGLSSVTLQSQSVTPVVVNTLSNITSAWDNGLILLSSSTPLQNRLNADTLYFTGETWNINGNVWPTTLEAIFYNESNTGVPIRGPNRPSFVSNLLASPYATFDGSTLKFSFSNCMYFTCFDDRSQKILGVNTEVVPVTYYDQTSNVYLSPGGSPNFSTSGTQLSNVSAKCATDESYRVYSACNSNNFLVQVLQNGTVNAVNYADDNRTANQPILQNGEEIVTTLHDDSRIYWVTRVGRVISYDTTKEFGSVGSISLLANVSTINVQSAAVTTRYISLSGDSNDLAFVTKSGQVVTYDQPYVPTGPMVWDGARYLYVYPTAGSNVLRLDTILYQNPSFVNGSMLVEYALVSEGERDWFKRIQNDHLIKQLQVSKFLIKAGTTEQQFDLSLKNLVSELLFTIDDDGLEGISLMFNGVPIIDYDDSGTALNLGSIQPYEHHARKPDRPFWMYSFAKYPNKMDPSGFVNMSRIVDQTISVRVIPSSVDRTFTVWADSYNVIRFRDGLAGMLYDYSTQ
jgi:hypothetical protein